MWRLPLALGGGMTMEYSSLVTDSSDFDNPPARSLVRDESVGLKAPEDSQAA